MKTTLLLAAALLLPACAVFGPRQVSDGAFHVSPTGSDAGTGTAESPFATLDHARLAAREWKAAHAGEPGAIVLHGGEYHMTQPVVFTPEDSGIAGKPLVISAAPGEKPVLTSATPITGWKLAEASPAIAKEAQGKVWVAEVPKNWLFHYLFANGEELALARQQKTDNWHAWPTFAKIGRVGPGGQELTVRNPADLAGLPSNGDVEMNLVPVQWWNSISVVRDIDPVKGTLRRHSKSPTVCDNPQAFIARGGHYNLQNASIFVTKPGEWAVNSAEGKVYFWPESGSPNALKMTAPTTSNLIQVIGNPEGKPAVQEIAFRGLTLTCTDRLPEDKWPDSWIKRNAELPDGTLVLDGVQGCEISNCTFLHTGAYAVLLRNYAQKNKIVRNEMGWLGCGGVDLIGFGPGTLNVNKDNLITRNYIHHSGRGGFFHSGAVTMYQSEGNEVSRNWISHVAYAGIQITGCGWNEFTQNRGKNPGSGKLMDTLVWDSYGETSAMYGTRWSEIPTNKALLTRAGMKQFFHSGSNIIRNNILFDYMETMNDGGPLYSWGCGNGNVWEGNLLRRTKSHPNQQWIFALYMDDYVDGATLKNNICWHNADATLNKGANKWEGNVVSREKPAKFDERLKTLKDEAQKEGGWLVTPEE